MNRIYLIGYMAAGKTTAGKELSAQLGMDFIDLDWFIESRFHKTINELFTHLGEEKFREIESKLLREIGDFENVIISTGGGTPCFHNNMTFMNQTGTTVYLKADSRTLTQRLNTNKEKRPLVKDKNESEIYDFVSQNLKIREPFYTQATHIIETGDIIATNIKLFVSNLVDSLKLNSNEN